MNLHQFRFVQEAVRRNLNLTETAKALFTSPPGISKAIIELEEGPQLFTNLVGVEYSKVHIGMPVTAHFDDVSIATEVLSTSPEALPPSAAPAFTFTNVAPRTSSISVFADPAVTAVRSTTSMLPSVGPAAGTLMLTPRLRSPNV